MRKLVNVIKIFITLKKTIKNTQNTFKKLVVCNIRTSYTVKKYQVRD